MIVEIIATTFEEAILAEKYGANRIELIHSFDLGGLSPTLELSKEVCNNVKIPVNVMVRPHGESFIYTAANIKTIVKEIEYLRDKTRANAIVFGALTDENTIDHKTLQQVIDIKGRLGLTFHRAIDEAENTVDAYKELLEYPEINLVLTSGGQATAIIGAENIIEMMRLNKGFKQCSILAGSGVTIENATELIKKTKVSQIHIGTGVRKDNQLSQEKFSQLFRNIAS